MNRSRVWDVIVVGAGPAGSTAARILADHGIEVLLLDRQRFPRRKACGGGLVWRALKQVPQTVIEDCVEAQYRTAWLHFAALAKTFVVKKSFPLISAVDRYQFDHAMLTEAVRKGAVFLSEAGCSELKIRRDTKAGNVIEVTAGGRRFLSRYVIAADGALSSVGRILRARDGRVLIPALEGRVVKGEVPGLERLAPFPRFDFGIVPGGYGWVFPKKETYCLGVVSYSRLSSRGSFLRIFLERYLAWLGIDGKRVRGLKGAFIPVSPRMEPVCSEGVLFVGDALGWVDPIMAEGISGAVISGTEAANAIIKGNGDKSEVLRIYRNAVERKFLREYRLSGFLARIVYYLPGFRDRCFLLYGHEIADVLADVFSGIRSYRWLLFWPANYLKAFGLFPVRFLRAVMRSCDYGSCSDSR